MRIGERDVVKDSKDSSKAKNKTAVFDSCVIMGTVTGEIRHKLPITVIAYPLASQEKKLIDYVILEEPGEYMLYVPEGSYHIYTITDFNDNYVFEQSEVSGVYGAPDRIAVIAGEVLTHIDIHTFSTGTNKIAFPSKIKIDFDYYSIEYRAINGQVVKIYDEIFSPENAETGWWSPSLFMEALGANIYFIEEYDQDKIPVLFVHGAKGSPQDWVYFFIRLDREHYQPWFFITHPGSACL